MADGTGSRRIAGSLIAAGVLLSAGFTSAVQARPLGSTLTAPKSGGTISIRLADTPDCLDPQKTAESASYTVFSEITEPLLSIDPKGKLVSDIATKYKTSGGGTKITFYLRPGLKFSNGDPLDASAVKYTFDRATNPATKSPATGPNLVAVKATKVINKTTVQVILKSPSRPILTNLAIEYEGILDPKATQQEGQGSCQKPIGAGPFKVSSVGPAFSTVTLVRNNLHTFNPPWVKNKGKPYLAKIVYKSITSDATAVSELLSGGLDITNVPGTELSRVRGNKAVVLHKIKTQGETFLGFNTAHAPFNSVDVRKAVAEAIDRRAIINASLAGLGAPVYSPVPPTVPYYDKKAPNYMPKLNTADATRLIAAAHATGPYDLLVPQGTTSQTAAELIQAELAAVGMKINVVVKPLSDYIPAAGKGQFDLNLLGWGYPDPDIMYLLFHSSQGKGAGLNFTNYVNPTLDRLLASGRTTLKQKKAAAIYAQFQELMNKQVVIVPLTVPTTIMAYRSRIKGYHTNAEGGVPLQDLYISGK